MTPGRSNNSEEHLSTAAAGSGERGERCCFRLSRLNELGSTIAYDFPCR